MLAAAIAFASALPTVLRAQEEGVKTNKAEQTEQVVHRIELINGQVYEGSIVSRQPETILLRIEGMPDLLIRYDEIEKMERVLREGESASGPWFQNPNSTRYLFAPSAFNLKKGEAYYQNTLLLLNSFNYGVTDWFSIGGGFEFITTFTSIAGKGPGAAFYITPKVSFPIAKNLRAGAGVLHVNAPRQLANPNQAGVAYGLVTYGNEDNNITLGTGAGYSENGWSRRPTVTLSGMYRVRPNVALVTENWFIDSEPSQAAESAADAFEQYSAFYSYGVRFFGEKVAVDLAFINNRGFAEQTIIGIPFVNFVVKL